MATKEELTEQLAVTQKLAAAVDQMARSMSRVESSFDTQISAVEKLTKAIETLRGQDLSGLNAQKLDGLQKEFKETEKQATTLTGRLKDMANWMAKKFPTSASAAAGAVSGFVQGMRNVLAIGKGVTGFLGGLVDTLGSVAASIIAIPFKMFNALVDMAAQAGGGANELAEALRKMRMEFGSLGGPTNKTIIETSKTLKGFSDTGLSAWRVFGNLAQRLEYMVEIAKGMGATFAQFTGEFQKNGGALLAYQKGLGISAEEMRGFGQLALSMGRDLSDVLKETTKYSYELGDAFKLDAKLISKDMSKALQDVKHFGGATVKQIAEASTYARKLGLELDKIVGTLDAFETFDTAAENAAKLSQSFGVTVDAFKLMQAQDPAEQVDQLRKAFLAAGKSADTMSRQELKLLAQTTGLDEATAKMAFSAKNQGLSLDEIKKKSGDAEKKTLTQAQAMSKLADAIERLVQSGGSQTGGFFDMFVKGFLGGIQASKEFREIIWNIKRSLQLVYFEGVRLGRAFVQMFPGVKEFLQGIADFFKPEKFKRLVGGVVDIFKDWMKDLTDPNGKASFANLMDKLKEKFFDFFNDQEGAGKKMVNGFKTVVKTITKVLAEGIKWAADKMGEGIQFIIDLLTGKQSLAGLAKTGEGGLGFLAEVLAPLGEALAHAWKVLAPKLWELVKTLGQKLWKYLTSDDFLNMVKPALPYIAAVLFGPALTRSLLSAATASLGKAAVSFLTGGGTKKVMESVAKKAAEQVLEASKKVEAKGGVGTGGVDQVGAATKASNQVMAEEKKGNWGVKDAVKLGLKLIAIATAIAIGGVEMAAAIWVMKKIMDNAGIQKPEDVLPQLLVLGAMVIAAVPLMLALRIAAKVGSISEIIKGGALIAVAVGIVGLVGAGLAWVMSKLASPAELDAAGTMMLKMSLVFLAMVPLIFASMAIGALASGPQAIALAAAAVGMGVIGVAVGEMATIAMTIIEGLAKLPIDKTFQQKIDAFLGVMKAIQAFTDSLVRVIELMAPTFIGFLTGTEEKFTTKIAAATELIKEMVGKAGQPGGLIGMIETVEQVIGRLGRGGPELAQGAQIFASVMEAVSSTLKALVPPDAFFEAGNSFLQRLVDPAWNYSSLTADVQNYSQKMQQQVMGMLQGADGKGGVLGLLDKLVSIQVPDAGKAKVVADMVAAIANVMKTITPDAETIKSMQDTGVKASYAWGLLSFDNKKSGLKPEDIGKIISEKSKGVQDIVNAITTGPLKTVIDSVGNLTAEKLGGVKVISDVMKVVVDLATAIGSSTKGKETVTLDKGVLTKVTDLMPDIADVMMNIGKQIGPLINALVGVVKTLPTDDKAFMKNMETASKLFSMLGEIPKMAQSISDVSKSSGGTGEINTEPLFKSVAMIAVFFWKLVNEKGYGTSRPVMQELIENIQAMGATGIDKAGAALQKTIDTVNNLFKGVTSLGAALKTALGLAPTIDANAATTVSTVLQNLSKTLSLSQPHIVDISATIDKIQNLKGVGDKLENYVSFLNKATVAAKADGIAKSLTAVADMVKIANDLDATLNAGLKIDTPVKLGKIASAVGLGGKFNYTIKNKEVVINMNVQVTMNVDEVEKVLILRKNSFVRDRINLALTESHVPEAKLPDNRDAPVVTEFQKGQAGP